MGKKKDEIYFDPDDEFSYIEEEIPEEDPRNSNQIIADSINYELKSEGMTMRNICGKKETDGLMMSCI